MMRILFLLCGFFLLAGCKTEDPYLDASGKLPLNKPFDSKDKPYGIRYKGFTIEPMPGSRWSVMTVQYSNSAKWFILNKKNIMHTTVGLVNISPVLAKDLQQSYTPEKLRTGIDKRNLNDPSGRLQNMQNRSWISERCKCKTVEYETTCLDPLSKYSKNKPLMLFIRGFALMTPKGQVIAATVSERFPVSEGEINREDAELFLNAIRW